jgi:hypothetical protein
MYPSSRARRIILTLAGAALLAAGPLLTTPAHAGGYPTAAACHEAGRAGVEAGYWPYYTCSYYQGTWRLNPA